jgi:uncharacterized membrane-anchored protein
MGLIQLLLVLVIVGVVLYLVKTYIPMDPAVRTVLTVVVVLVLCLWLLQLVVGDIPLPRFHR